MQQRWKLPVQSRKWKLVFIVMDMSAEEKIYVHRSCNLHIMLDKCRSLFKVVVAGNIFEVLGKSYVQILKLTILFFCRKMLALKSASTADKEHFLWM